MINWGSLLIVSLYLTLLISLNKNITRTKWCHRQLNRWKEERWTRSCQMHLGNLNSITKWSTWKLERLPLLSRFPDYLIFWSKLLILNRNMFWKHIMGNWLVNMRSLDILLMTLLWGIIKLVIRVKYRKIDLHLVLIFILGRRSMRNFGSWGRLYFLYWMNFTDMCRVIR